MMMTSLLFVQVISFSRALARRTLAGLWRGRDAAGLWLVMLLILFVHPLLGETGDALDSAVWVFDQIWTVSGP